MYIHATKKQKNKSQSFSSGVSQMLSSGESTFQFVDNRPEAVAQRKLQNMVDASPQAKQTVQLLAMSVNYSTEQQQPIQKKENNTSLPDNLKTGMENLSGMSLDDVKVHHNSDKPAKLQAYAYAQGTDIHLASGQEKHLPHEAWHVVQQKQGRVKPTMQMKGKVSINDDAGLEKEADLMGARSMKHQSFSPDKSSENVGVNQKWSIPRSSMAIIQGVFKLDSEYKFTAERLDQVHPFKDKLVYGFKFDSNEFVTKKEGSKNEAQNNRIASIGLLEAPDMRQLKQSEADGLSKHKALISVNNQWWLMNKMKGQTLTDASVEDEKNDSILGGRLKKIEFTEDQWIDIGKTAAHQVFVSGYDRWKLSLTGFEEGECSRLNPDNTMISDTEKITVFDTPSSKNVMGESKKQLSDRITPYIKGILSDKKGEVLIQDVWKNGLINIAEDNENKGSFMRKGFIEFMEAVTYANYEEDKELDERFASTKIVTKVLLPKKNNCYITTACTQFRGLTDDCEELTVLRQFRDSYILDKPNGEELVKLYYAHSPDIVEAIRSHPDEAQILKCLYHIIRRCVDAINEGDYQFAFITYYEMVMSLKEEFIPHKDIAITEF